MKKKWLGCPNCKTFTRLNVTTLGWICQDCNKYCRACDALNEKNMVESSKQVGDSFRPASNAAKKLYKGMEKKTEKWVKDVKAGRLPYTDPNTGRKVQ